jgi:chromosome segregation ATPase
MKLKNKIHDLEKGVMKVEDEKRDMKFELEKTLKGKQVIEEQLGHFKNETMKFQGDVESSEVQLQRLQVFYTGAQTELMNLKQENEALLKSLKTSRFELVEAERKSSDYYNQLQSNRESLSIIKNEQKLLTEEINHKIQELGMSERARTSAERELLELRPLRQQIAETSQYSQKQMSETMKVESEKSRLVNKVTELNHQLSMTQDEVRELEGKWICEKSTKEKLLDQLRLFERESSDIKLQIKRSLEAEQEAQMLRETIEHLRMQEREFIKEIEILKSRIS